MTKRKYLDEITYDAGQLPEIVVTPNSKSNYLVQNYKDDALSERNRQRTIAKHYFQEAPTIPNLYNAINAYAKSLPIVGINEYDVMGKYKPLSGVVPTDGTTNRNLYGIVNRANNIKNAVTNIPYTISKLPGYQLKSLMRGNPLEKQLSKIGTINVNSIKAQTAKGSNVEKAVIDKVLASERFAGQNSIDYNTFRKAVQDELITYKRVPSTYFESYGISRLGFRDKLRKGIVILRDVTPNTFTFESPRIPIGNGTHYNPTTLGHSRTYTTMEEPNILHVMESQSDWAQHKPTKLLNRHGIKNLSKLEEEIAFQKAKVGLGYDIVDWKDELKQLEAARYYLNPETSYLVDNFARRQLQENLKYAAERGQTKMRYPTSETAAKIEGYVKKPLTKEQIVALNKKYKKPKNYYDKPTRENFNLEGMSEEEAERIFQDFEASEKWDRSKASIDFWKEFESLRDYYTEHKTILKKYSDFTKMYNRLYKGAEVRTVTDAKGNTWYEVDVPKDYLQQEWPYKYGGSIKI